MKKYLIEEKKTYEIRYMGWRIKLLFVNVVVNKLKERTKNDSINVHVMMDRVKNENKME